MRFILAVLACAACAGCAGLPPLDGRVESRALPDTQETRLARAASTQVAAHPGLTGVHALPLGTDAFAARVLLARAAERSIDMQYYIWHADQTGLLLMEAVRDAGVRGVRVRLLLDDQDTSGMDGLLGALAATPNVQVRLYNPFANRSVRWVGYLGDFGRLNRRMHNKSFIVDNQAAIIGGRNIGNEYFGAGAEIPFMDLDVVALGRAVPEISAQFDLYWNSASAYPIASVVSAAPEEIDARFAAARADPVSTRYIDAVRDTPLVSDLLARKLALDWVTATVVRDDPAKTLDPSPERGMLALAQIFDITGPPQRSFDLISPYFVPGEAGTSILESVARRGVAVRVLTNSYASNDVAIVHSGYAKRRCALAVSGVRLYELKPERRASAARDGGVGASGSSAAALHAKTFAVDSRYVFVGSFNFDLRSGLLNTELGLVLQSPALAQRLSQGMDKLAADNSYAVRPVAGKACVEWIDRTAAGDVTLDTEPNTSAWGRFMLQLYMALPIDWLL